MPSSATITAFYNFTANTKARATQVNNNFDVLRGHIISIDPNTSTAATTETYDLGSTEYRWRTGYFREVDLKSNTSTGQALQIVGDTASGQGAMLFKHGGNIRARIGGGNNYIDLDTTTSQFDFKFNGSTMGSFTTNGFSRQSIKRGSIQEVAPNTSGAYNITGTSTLLFTLSITSNGHINMLGVNLSRQTVSAFYISTSQVGNSSNYVKIYRDGTSAADFVGQMSVYASGKETSTSSEVQSSFDKFCFDFSCTAGNHTYYVYVQAFGSKIAGDNYDLFQCIELI